MHGEVPNVVGRRNVYRHFVDRLVAGLLLAWTFPPFWYFGAQNFWTRLSDHCYSSRLHWPDPWREWVLACLLLLATLKLEIVSAKICFKRLCTVLLNIFEKLIHELGAWTFSGSWDLVHGWTKKIHVTYSQAILLIHHNMLKMINQLTH